MIGPLHFLQPPQPHGRWIRRQEGPSQEHLRIFSRDPSMGDTIYPQAAVIPYRLRSGRVEVALVTSRGGDRWIIPKGLIDPGESAAESAAREAEEEAGLTGEVSRRRASRYEYPKWGGTCLVDVYLMHVTKVHRRWPEEDLRDREWCSVREAARRVREAEIKRLILSLPAHCAVARRKSA